LTNSHTLEITTEPSPTEEATRLTDPARTSPTANTPGSEVANGVADFSLPSRAPRFHLVNLADGSVRSHLVAHGKGSDPSHTGWLERFSNEPRSNATSAGTYRTGSLYMGAHGRSMRLEGLDPTNSNALSRAIVVHGAWYVNEQVIGHSGMLGRSQGCFAVADSSLPEIMGRLGSGRLIYAGKA
jgi:L,D-transpeptidase catalytic domain